MSERERADRLLVQRGLFESRARAQAAIAAGLVAANGVPVRKASDGLPRDAELLAIPAHPWVSRGGVKLAAALDAFTVEVAGRVCLDVGASTGGFTEVLLRRGAARVYAVDVGRNQVHPSLRERPDVVVLEQTDIRSLEPSRLEPRPDLAAVDVSFISLAHVLPVVSDLLAGSADMLTLIKPQFEAGRRHLKKGILRDPAVQKTVCDRLIAVAVSLGWRARGLIPSPIVGGDGNREFLFAASRP